MLTDFLEKWFGNQLYEMGEPSFSQLAKDKENKHVRLLVVPTSTPSIALRIAELESAEPSLTCSTLDGLGGYDPGGLDQRETYTLKKQNMTALLEALESFDAWQGGFPPKRETIYTDGTRVVLEMAQKSFFHVVSLQTCELLPSTEALIQEFFSLAPEFDGYCLGCKSPWSR